MFLPWQQSMQVNVCPENDITPSPAPECLKKLSPIHRKVCNFTDLPIHQHLQEGVWHRKNQTRYEMFLQSVMLVHKPGTTFHGVFSLSLSQFEMEVAEFTISPECPKLVTEEFNQKQKDEDVGEEDNGEADIAHEVDLLLHLDDPQELIEQENWQGLMEQVHEKQHLQDREGDYGNEEMLNLYSKID